MSNIFLENVSISNRYILQLNNICGFNLACMLLRLSLIHI